VSAGTDQEFESTADMIEGLVMRSCRRSGVDLPAREVRAEAERVAPEFDRLWGERKAPYVGVDLDRRGRVVLSVTADA
jgi:hypothetical protein